MIYGVTGLNLQTKERFKKIQLSFEKKSLLTVQFEHGILGVQPAKAVPVKESDSQSMVICGHLFEPSGRVEPNCSLPINRYNGIYSFAIWNEAQNTVTIGTDRYGFRPLYYCYDRDILYFSSDFDWLIRVVPTKFSLNWNVFCQHLHLCHSFGNSTLLEGIRRVPQGVNLIFAPRKKSLKRQSYYDYRDLNPDLHLSRNEVLAQASDKLLAAIERQSCHREDALVLLSGGYDSRVLVYGLNLLGKKIKTFTTHTDLRYLTDVSVAQKIASMLNIPHSYVPLPPEYLADYHFEKSFLVNFETSYHNWIMPLLKNLPPTPELNYDGLGGDGCLGASEAIADFWDPWQRDDYYKATKYHFAWYKTSIRYLFTPQWHGYIAHEARNAHFHEVKKYWGHPNGLTYIGLNNFTRRAISLSPYGILANKLESAAPFFDHELFEWMMAIPIKLKIDYALYPDIVHNFTSKLSALPSTHTREHGGEYFAKSPIHWKKKNNLGYLWHKISQLKQFIPDLIAPTVKDKILQADLSGGEFETCLGLADMSLFFTTYQDRIKLELPNP